MVICLQLIKKCFLKVLMIFLGLFFMFVVSYYVTYLKYNDKDVIEKEVLILENQNLKDENGKLLEAMSLKEHNPDYVMTRVIVRDIHKFYSEVVVDEGEGVIKKGNAVVNSDGLIGLVSDVKNDRSFVKLLTGEYNVSVVVNGAYGNLNNGYVTLNDKYVEIKKGDKVYTSGLTSIPKDIFVGEVLAVSRTENDLTQRLEVNLINNNNLNYVAILVGD